MGNTIIKICGITRAEDGQAAIEAGADWLGFIRWPGSVRFRPLEQCADILATIRANTPREFVAVGVYVDPTQRLVEEEFRKAGLDRVQLHGDESLALILALGLPAIKTIKISDRSSVDRAEAYPGIDLLADTADDVLHGGTGRTYDLAFLGDLADRRRIIVAGGLRPDNVAEVLERVRPFGVDVSSGVESSPGIKDHEKVAGFVAAVRAVDNAGKAG